MNSQPTKSQTNGCLFEAFHSTKMGRWIEKKSKKLYHPEIDESNEEGNKAQQTDNIFDDIQIDSKIAA